MTGSDIDKQQRKIAYLLGRNARGENLSGLFQSNVKRGAQPSCPLFSDKIADYFDKCFPGSFELFMLFYETEFPFSKIKRGMYEDFGLIYELEESGEY